MNVGELIVALQKLPPKSDVVIYDEEWGEYEDITAASATTVEVSVEKSNQANSRQYMHFVGGTSQVYRRVVATKDVVELHTYPYEDEEK